MADFPHVALKVNAAGRGTLIVNGVELQVSTVRIEVDAGRGSRLRFEMLAYID